MSYNFYEIQGGVADFQSATAVRSAGLASIQQEIEALSQDPNRALALRDLDNQIAICNGQLAFISGRLQELLRQRSALFAPVSTTFCAMQGTTFGVPPSSPENRDSGLVDNGKYEIEVTPDKVIYTRPKTTEDKLVSRPLQGVKGNGSGQNGGGTHRPLNKPVLFKGKRLRGSEIEEFVSQVREIASQVFVPPGSGENYVKNFTSRAIKVALRDGRLPDLEKIKRPPVEKKSATTMPSPETTASSGIAADDSVSVLSRDDDYAATVNGVDYTYSQLCALAANHELPERSDVDESSDDPSAAEDVAA